MLKIFIPPFLIYKKLNAGIVIVVFLNEREAQIYLKIFIN